VPYQKLGLSGRSLVDPGSYVGLELRCHSQLEHKLKTNFENPSICFHWAVEAVRPPEGLVNLTDLLGLFHGFSNMGVS
jgi:hypothetical protein